MSFGTVQAEKVTTESGYSLGAGNSTSFKNRLINGEMDIDQRNAGSSVTLNNGGSAYVYTVDRWAAFSIKNNVIAFQQNAGGVTPPAGFSNYLGATSLAATTVASSDITVLKQPIEANNVSDFGLGTANARSFTVSFWVRSSLTGTFGGSVSNSAVTYIYPFSFVINSANTWEYKTITVTGPTAGTWLTGNSAGLQLFFSLGTGSTYLGTANTWQSSAGGLFAPTGSTNLIATNGATFYVTGVQLEVGTVATSFDFRSIGTELALCQRYFYPITLPRDSNNAYPAVVYANTTILIQALPVTIALRASPTVTVTSGTAQPTFIRYDGGASSAPTVTNSFASVRSSFNTYWFEIQWVCATSWGSANNVGSVQWNTGTSYVVNLSSEL